ncbi:hypothetical protein Droror1_Dr00022008 [Drosera rotundifolia]
MWMMQVGFFFCGSVHVFVLVLLGILLGFWVDDETSEVGLFLRKHSQWPPKAFALALGLRADAVLPWMSETPNHILELNHRIVVFRLSEMQGSISFSSLHT